jgi:hypothetical protein
VQAAVRPASTGIWQPAVDLGIGTDARVALDATGNAVSIWRFPAPSGSLRSAYRPVGGAWSTLADVSRAPATAGDVAVDDGGNAIAVWLAGAGPHVRSARRDRATGAWSAPLSVSAAGTAAGQPSLAVDERGNAVVAWTRAASRTVRAALRPAALGTWLTGVGISAPGVVGANPLVELAADGRALAVWMRRAPGVSLVESAELAGTGPILAGALPTGAAARRATRFTVRSAAWTAPLAGAPVWRFGDGSTATGASVTHTYTARGTFTVTVNQSDAAGGASSRTTRVNVVAVLNLGRPSIAGSPNAGSTLTCRKGSWTGVTPIQYAFRWRRNGQLISGARSQTFVVRQGDAGAQLACSVVATNSVGSSTASSAAVRIVP